MDFARWGCLIVKCLFFCLLQEGSRYAVLFLGLLNKINNNDAIQYVLTLIDDMIGTAVVRGHFLYIYLRLVQPAEQNKRIQLFIGTSKVAEDLPFTPLIKCLEKDNAYIMTKASKLVSAILWYEKILFPLFQD